MKNNDFVGKPLAIFIMGPTAVGKTSVAIALKKQQCKIDIISVDSGLVYRGMDIGTAKPIPEELRIAPHKLINIRDPAECYSLADFYHDANRELNAIVQAGRVPVFVGGTMLYFKTFLQGLFLLPKADKNIRRDIQHEAHRIGWINIYNQLKLIDPVSANIIHMNDHKRIIRALEIFFISGKTWTELKLNSDHILANRILQFAIMPVNREMLNKRIEQRFYKMLEIGFENEVSMLFVRRDLHQSMKPSILCVGYRQMWEYLSGNISYNVMITTAISATRQLAKRQMTWLRKWPSLYWLDSDNLSVVVENLLKILTRHFIY